MANRRFILEKILLDNGFTKGAELGVLEGRTLFHLLGRIGHLKLIAVDLWRHQEGYDDLANTYNLERFFEEVVNKAEKFRDRLVIMRMLTSQASNYIRDGSLDFVFIDANHSYRNCSEDIELWGRKVRKGGMITGHDWDWEGVREAVTERLGEAEVKENVWLKRK